MAGAERHLQTVPRIVEVRAEVQGPIIGATRDVIIWVGEVTLLRDFGADAGVQLNWGGVLRVVDYRVERDRDDSLSVDG